MRINVSRTILSFGLLSIGAGLTAAFGLTLAGILGVAAAFAGGVTLLDEIVSNVRSRTVDSDISVQVTQNHQNDVPFTMALDQEPNRKSDFCDKLAVERSSQKPLREI